MSCPKMELENSVWFVKRSFAPLYLKPFNDPLPFLLETLSSLSRICQKLVTMTSPHGSSSFFFGSSLPSAAVDDTAAPLSTLPGRGSRSEGRKLEPKCLPRKTKRSSTLWQIEVPASGWIVTLVLISSLILTELPHNGPPPPPLLLLRWEGVSLANWNILACEPRAALMLISNQWEEAGWGCDDTTVGVHETTPTEDMDVDGRSKTWPEGLPELELASESLGTREGGIGHVELKFVAAVKGLATETGDFFISLIMASKLERIQARVGECWDRLRMILWRRLLWSLLWSKKRSTRRQVRASWSSICLLFWSASLEWWIDKDPFPPPETLPEKL